MTTKHAFRKATLADAPIIAALVESAYRGDASRAGWTTEADFLHGRRTDVTEIRELLASEDGHFVLFEREGEKWPKVVALRLHLKGLESVRACNGMATLDAAVSVQDGKPTVRSWKDGKRTPCWAAESRSQTPHPADSVQKTEWASGWPHRSARRRLPS